MLPAAVAQCYVFSVFFMFSNNMLYTAGNASSAKAQSYSPLVSTNLTLRRILRLTHRTGGRSLISTITLVGERLAWPSDHTPSQSSWTVSPLVTAATVHIHHRHFFCFYTARKPISCYRPTDVGRLCRCIEKMCICIPCS